MLILVITTLCLIWALIADSTARRLRKQLVIQYNDHVNVVLDLGEKLTARRVADSSTIRDLRKLLVTAQADLDKQTGNSAELRKLLVNTQTELRTSRELRKQDREKYSKEYAEHVREFLILWHQSRAAYRQVAQLEQDGQRHREQVCDASETAVKLNDTLTQVKADLEIQRKMTNRLSEVVLSQREEIRKLRKEAK